MHDAVLDIFKNGTWIDLTHTLHPDIPSWTGSCGFHNQVKRDYHDQLEPLPFRIQQLKMHAGIGTHIDAPSHCFAQGCSVERITLQSLISPCFVVDVSQKAHDSYSLSALEILEFETKYGKISADSLVLIHTGWSQFWDEPNRYRNNHRFPSISEEAASLLLTRNIAGLGIDTLSPDRPDSSFPVHRLFLGHGKYLIENIAHTDLLPPTGSIVFALPIKVLDGTEAPLRLIGWKPTSATTHQVDLEG